MLDIETQTISRDKLKLFGRDSIKPLDRQSIQLIFIKFIDRHEPDCSIL